MTAPAPISEQEKRRRRTILRFVRLGLLVTVVIVAARLVAGDGRRSDRSERSERRERVRVERLRRDAPNPATVDVRIISIDGNVQLMLRGNEIYAGLSDETVQRIRTDLARERGADSSGMGAAIAGLVKKTVAENIGTHAVYNVHSIADVDVDDGRIIVTGHDGKRTALLGSIKTEGDKEGVRFSDDDAERFVEAVRARMH